ncbi:hypothetical protein [Fluviispira multicolorata]|uniref:Uncharacterized protein n=1 Tax=Fluviispira multicolorata TaxID=2654512 RepID=A0A833JG73_9BACT|nr:hypothetical protein [Fluviispira multicolorata]KAB8031991.1 hypothetical protein GCL57_04915 [Fluviispira multicolorata]
MKNELCREIKSDLIDMIKYLNNSDLRMNDTKLYFEFGGKISNMIERVAKSENDLNENSLETSKNLKSNDTH